jgi:hypothetical protein
LQVNQTCTGGKNILFRSKYMNMVQCDEQNK